MNPTRLIATLAAPVLAAGFAVATTGAATAADVTPESVCASAVGQFYADADGTWECFYFGVERVTEDALASVCDTTPAFRRLPSMSGFEGSTTFICAATAA